MNKGRSFLNSDTIPMIREATFEGLLDEILIACHRLVFVAKDEAVLSFVNSIISDVIDLSEVYKK